MCLEVSAYVARSSTPAEGATRSRLYEMTGLSLEYRARVINCAAVALIHITLFVLFVHTRSDPVAPPRSETAELFLLPSMESQSKPQAALPPPALRVFRPRLPEIRVVEAVPTFNVMAVTIAGTDDDEQDAFCIAPGHPEMPCPRGRRPPPGQ